ncbi:4-hydroxyphenylpyruvate dioxygenase [Rippkaea orientalis PCC 8801]|uniref:4-hydroxyphenylpyruvate dioxygenase n=2 Tax=Rippkaea TaxID=2546365 RepID=B7K095_RIPO1|nr:4-hydroxyphenylpyruvate dioxygenase [Rippkaea orientalis PCC 8801]
MEIDHIHFYVEDAAHQRDWFIDKMGFQSISNSIHDDTYSEVVGNQSVYFILSSPLNDASPVSYYLKSHPPGVADVAFRVDNLNFLLDKVSRFKVEIINQSSLTAFPLNKPVKFAKLKGWGSVNHTLIDQASPRTFISSKMIAKSDIIGIDHVVLNVPQGELPLAINWYKNVFDFISHQQFNIQTEHSGLSSEALVDSSGKVQFNINQPSSTNSQIQEFLDHNNGSGIQHIGLKSSNILQSVAQMRQRGLPFLSVPNSYYQNLKELIRKSTISCLSQQELEQIETEQILVCWPEDNPTSILMQIFTQPIFKQPTFFFELIQRRNQAQGFGQGNFQALFEAIESEQIKRNRVSSRVTLQAVTPQS